MLKFYYFLKPSLPRSLILFIRRVRARFIYWRIRGVMVSGDSKRTAVLPSPGSAGVSTILMTHDVESSQGLSRIEGLRRIERQFDIRSTWCFVVDKYGDVADRVKDLVEEGCECAAHGLHHDGRLFSDPRLFEERMVIIHSWAARMGIVGFRSPSMLRDEVLMRRLPFLWDSSFPAWDPFQPQPGGCGRYEPFLLSPGLVELPVTVWQDYTIFEELGSRDISLWKSQISQIHRAGGLINMIVHPDYMSGGRRLGLFNELLEYLSELPGAEFRLPRELAQEFLARSEKASADDGHQVTQHRVP